MRLSGRSLVRARYNGIKAVPSLAKCNGNDDLAFESKMRLSAQGSTCRGASQHGKIDRPYAYRSKNF